IMRRFTRAAAAVSTAAVTAGLLVSCAASEEKAVPKLPERICWGGGAFAGSDVAPLLPPGDKADGTPRAGAVCGLTKEHGSGTGEFTPRSGAFFALTKELDSATCNLYIDGNTKFQAIATRRNFAESIDWSSWDSADPKPLDLGDKGIIYDTGAHAYFTCEPAKNPNSPGKYIELRIHADDAPDKSKLQAALPALMKEFMAFAQRELKCPGSAAGGA
ncbi:hypothetical protein, partial [Streptomyces anthocyanicus]|uniref:hypothetical protein n=1 Tax=Streptomyces anthocyanicus TaxID=68174 RepID=UPI00364DD349